MNKTFPRSYWRIFNIIFFSVVFFFLLKLAYRLISETYSPDGWLVGDWLINYQGGFVRRGLLGEIFFFLTQWTGVNIVSLVVIFQVLVYLTFMINTCGLAMNSFFSKASAILIYSPAFILFPILEIQGSYRKEILLFAFLATICKILSNPKKKISRFMPIWIGAFAVFLVLNHELLVAYLPYTICAFIIFDKGLSSKVKYIGLSLIPAYLTTLFLIFFCRGNADIVTRICASLGTSVPKMCTATGAIYSLGISTDVAQAQVVSSTGGNTLLIYGAVILLGLIPFVLLYFTKLRFTYLSDQKTRFWVALCILLAIISSLPFFWVAVDYGRLIYIHITCLSLIVLLMIREEDQTAPLAFKIKEIPLWLLVILFSVSWRLQHNEATFIKSFQLIKSIMRLLT